MLRLKKPHTEMEISLLDRWLMNIEIYNKRPSIHAQISAYEIKIWVLTIHEFEKLCAITVDRFLHIFIIRFYLQSTPVHSAKCVREHVVTFRRVLSSAPL
jgi:hypothetical protein